MDYFLDFLHKIYTMSNLNLYIHTKIRILENELICIFLQFCLIISYLADTYVYFV